MPRRIAVALALASSFSLNAWADFRVDFEAKAQGDVPALSRIELSGEHMRVDAGTMSTLFDTGSGRMLVVQNDKHQYLDVQKAAETAGAAMAKASAALANLPPDQRAMIEQRMGGHMPGAGGAKVVATFTPTGASDRVGGYSCQIFRTEIDGRHVSDACVANASDAGISAADQATLRKAFEQIKAMTEKMSAGMFKSPVDQMPTDKFPVRIVQFDASGKQTQVVQIKSVTTSTVAGSDFAIPAGYTEQDLSSLVRHH
jgi:Domain of unknown function (DUF4412)